MTTRAFFKVCRVLIFLNKIVEKKHILNPEINLLYQFHAQKAMFKVPKACNIIFGLKMTHPPLELSRKFIQFGSATLPFSGRINGAVYHQGYYGVANSPAVFFLFLINKAGGGNLQYDRPKRLDHFYG